MYIVGILIAWAMFAITVSKIDPARHSIAVRNAAVGFALSTVLFGAALRLFDSRLRSSRVGRSRLNWSMRLAAVGVISIVSTLSLTQQATFAGFVGGIFAGIGLGNPKDRWVRSKPRIPKIQLPED